MEHVSMQESSQGTPKAALPWDVVLPTDPLMESVCVSARSGSGAGGGAGRGATC